MVVTTIRVGSMGRGIGSRLVAGGHRVTFIDLDPDNARELADSLNNGSMSGGSASKGQSKSMYPDMIRTRAVIRGYSR